MNPDGQPPVVPDHELLRRVGRGSYGEVWLARNVMASFRAVKIVYRASFDSPRPYEREFNGLQKFEPVSRSHPGLMSILHVGRNEEPECFYCIMEVADDLDAGQLIIPEQYRPRTLAAELARQGRIPLSECIELGVALASALEHLHSYGLVHRDIKPSNIIFTGGLPKLADIGLVTPIGSKATFVGTTGYIPPEGPGSPLADIYSLGRVIYEISLGKNQDQFPELPTRLRELPEAGGLIRLNNIVLKACAPQSAHRFSTAKELGAALAMLRTGSRASLPENPVLESSRPVTGSLVVILPLGKDAGECPLTRQLQERLVSEGFVALIDDQRELGVKWARRLEQIVSSAHAIIPIIGPIQNEFAAYSLEIARQALRRTAGQPVLIPIGFDLPEPLPLHLAMSLEGVALIRAKLGGPQLIDQIIARLQLSEKSIPNPQG